MNRIYRLVWNHALSAWVAVSESAKGRGKSASTKRCVVGAIAVLVSPLTLAAPVGGQVSAGSGSIAQSGLNTTITQSSQKLSLSWQSFNTRANETVNFKQPSASAIVVNRIHDTNGTQFFGHLNANGQIYLINPNGILFGQGAQVNVGGLVASTLDTTNGSTFSGNGTGAVVNEGTINAANYVALLGNSVTNSGVITAQLGTVAMGAGSDMSLTFSGNSLVKIQVNKSVIDSLVANHGLIKADGGMVVMNAGARDTLLASVVNNDGIVQAQTVQNHSGTITLLGGMQGGTVNVGGTLDASAPNGGNGGFIETSAAHVHVTSDANVTTQAASGLNGNWLIDPVDFTIAASGGDMTGAALATSLGGGNVSILSTSGASGTAGDINVNDTVSWGANLLTLNAQNNININAPMNATGTADLALKYGQASTTGGSSTYNVNAPVNLASGTSFSTQLGSTGTPITWTVITTLGAQGDATAAPTTMSLQGVNTGLTGHYVLGADIAASGTSTWNAGAGLTPIGSSTNTAFAGVFDGLGHTITSLYINRPSTSNVGLFGFVNGGTVRNVGLVGGSVTGSMRVGGLAGVNTNTGTISNAYASSSVTGYFIAGGLVGYNNSTISNSYATGSVTSSVTGTNTEVGGLVGYNNTGGNISDSYASGRVTGIGAGGLVGQNFGTTTISNSYWDTTTSGTTNGIGTGTNAGGSHAGIDVGLSTAQMKSAASFSGWNMASSGGSSATWRIYEGQSAPLLRGFLTPITVTANNASKSYDGVAYNGSAGVSYSATPNATLLGTVSYSAGTNAGSYTLTPSGLFSTSNQGFDVSYATGTLTVNKAHLTVTANNASRLYGAANPALTTTVSGFVNGETTATAAGYTGSGSATTTANAATNVGSAVITAGAGTLVATNYDFTNLVNGTLTVNPATLTYTANAASRTYGAGNPAFSGSVSGFVNGQTLATATAGSTSFTSAATTGSSVGSYAIDGSGLTANNGNYIFAQAAGNATALTVNKAALTVTATSTNKNYGQAPTLTAFTHSALQNGETIGSVTETSPGTAAAANVGSYTITPSAATGGTFNPSNYTISYANGALTVNKAHLTVTANNASRLYCAANPTFTTTVSGFVNGESATSAAGYTGTGSATTTANTATNVGTAVITAAPGTLAANNYDFTNLVNGALTVNPAPLTVTATSTSKSYGQTPTLTAFTHSALQNGETIGSVTETSPGTAATASVAGGPYTITPSAATGGTFNANNYAITYATGLLTVNPAALTVRAGSASKSYGQTPTLTLFTSSGLQNGETIGSVTETSAGTSATAGVAGGPYTITPSAATGGTFNANNYAITYATGLLTVNPATLTYTATAASRTYGSANPAFSGSVSGFVNGETLTTATTGGASFTSAATTGSNVGSYAIDGSGLTANNGNYIFAQATGNATALTVNPATLTYTATAASRTYGAANPAFSGSVSGFVNGETLSGATTGSATFGSAATTGSNVGSYAIDGSGLTANNGNYIFAQATGNATALTVNPAPLTVTANSASKSYGQTPTLTAFTHSALQNGETIGSVTETSAGTAATASVAGGPYTITPSAATGGTFNANNYAITYATGLLTVNPAALTVTATSASKSYGQTPVLTAFTHSALQNGETIGSVTEASAGTAATASVAGGPYTITPSAATGGTFNPSNYTISYVNGTLTVNKAALTVTAQAAGKTYDGLSYSGGNGVAYTGLMNGESASVLGGTLAYGGSAQGAVNAGSYLITPFGLTSSNYSISFVDGALTINPAALAVTANAASMADTNADVSVLAQANAQSYDQASSSTIRVKEGLPAEAVAVTTVQALPGTDVLLSIINGGTKLPNGLNDNTDSKEQL